MKSSKEGKEKRQHKRYTISAGAFALVKWNGSEILGAIKDISAGGLSLYHIDGNEALENLSKVTINLISGKTCHENFTGRTIWNQKEEGGFTTPMVKMKRRGIMFEQHNSAMQLELQNFIGSLLKK